MKKEKRKSGGGGVGRDAFSFPWSFYREKRESTVHRYALCLSYRFADGDELRIKVIYHVVTNGTY